MPWKNGGGSTTEIAVDPPGAGVADAFLWRLSLARVERSGPFSPFPGYERSIMLMSGGGMALDFGDHGGARLERPFEPVGFQGEWPTTATLLGGPSEDFNVMTDRARLRHELTVSRPLAPLELPPVPAVAILCCHGRVEVQGLGSQALMSRETLIVDDPGPLVISGPGIAAVVLFQLRS